MVNLMLDTMSLLIPSEESQSEEIQSEDELSLTLDYKDNQGRTPLVYA